MAKKKPKSGRKKPVKKERIDVSINIPKPLKSAWRIFADLLDKKVVFLVSFLLMLFIYLAYYTIQGMDYDVWWHMQYGRHFVENLTWNIDHSNYSWVETSSDWKYVSWLGDLILLLVYNVSGWFGLKKGGGMVGS